MQNIQSYKDLLVWKKSVDLSVLIYEVTSVFPREEVYGLISQMRRASVSVASNIAEGSIRGSKKDFCHFLRIASGSIAEIQTQIEITRRLTFGQKIDFSNIEILTIEINKMIHGLIKKLQA